MALSTPWIDVTKEPDFEERGQALEAKARVILSRFPEGSRFYANTGHGSDTRDYYQRVSGWNSFRAHLRLRLGAGVRDGSRDGLVTPLM
ncbi:MULTISPECIES: hypothetical protein [unclassified Streptomyces]|uniref:hypothetical protein n=1 Tax=unclassified Streptomyces TaxID=2593676 RepID=UPI0033AE30E8